MSKDSKYLEGLNKEQIQAVTFGNGPLLIVAGAGTGKTTVITRRIAYLVEEKGIESDNVLALTFTDKAAGEMEERADNLFPFGYLNLWISTFHSFCERILKEYALDIGLPSQFKLLNQTEAWLLIKKNLDKFNFNYYEPIGNPTYLIHSLVNHFSRCKDEGIYPEDYLEYADKLKTSFDSGLFGSKSVKSKDKKEEIDLEVEEKRIKEIADAYHIYQRILLENNSLDFGDLINYCLRLFKERPQILKKYQEQFKYILVDEFQDTNWAQYELVKLLGKPGYNITACADDDQAIYRFRGASFNNVLRFKQDFPDSKEIVLIKNYRSGQDILDLAYEFIKLNNPYRLEYQLNQDKDLLEEIGKRGLELKDFKKISKKLSSQVDEKGIIEHLHFKSLEEESRGVAEKIIELLNNNSAESYFDFAVLMRSNSMAEPFSKTFERIGIPYQFLASKGLYSQPVVLDIISYLKFIDNYNESASLFRILASPIFNIPYDDIVKITSYSRIKTLTLYESLEKLPLIYGISKEGKEKINSFLSLAYKHSNMARNRNVSVVLIDFLNESGYLKYLVKNNKIREINLLNQFFKKVQEFEEIQENPILSNFIDLLNMELEAGELGKLSSNLEEGPDMVRMMTIHSAKGLEFPYVFLVNLVDKRFPSISQKDPIEIPKELEKEIISPGDAHLQEERRLFYVGMTRAKKGIFLTSADDYGGQRKKKPSRFLYELGIEKKEKSLSQESLFEKKEIKKKEKLSLPKYFSFSQLAAFAKCPLQYKLGFLLKVPRKGNYHFSFGKTIHNTLYQYLNNFNKGKQEDLFQKKVKEKDLDEEYKKLIEIYEKNWIDEWYENKKEKEKYYGKGKKLLKDFLKRFLKEKPEIKALEKDFKIKVGDDTLIGVIDRIDNLTDGGIKIIDYKTGKIKEDKNAKIQLFIYQLAAEDIWKEIPSELSFYYVEEGKEIAFKLSGKQKDKFKEELLKRIKEIKESDFRPTPGFYCKYCDFKHICEFKKVD